MLTCLSQMSVRKQCLSLGMLLFLLVVGPVFSTHAAARSSRATKEYTDSKKPKTLKKLLRRKIAKDLTKGLLKDEFFKGRELPIRIVLARIYLDGDGLDTTAPEFTNLILNELLNSESVQVVNQDLKIDLSLRYQLMEYLADYPARKQGVLLGADYYVRGVLKSSFIHKDDGKPDRHYTAELELRRIRSDKLLVRSTFDEKHKKKRKRKR